MTVRRWVNLFTVITLIFISLLCITNASASQCNIKFNYGVVIDPIHIRVLKSDKTYVQINSDNQLFVEGREIVLTPENVALVSQFSSGIRQQVPQMVAIAIEGVDVGLNAVSKVIASVTGENSAAHQKLQERFDELQWRLRKRFNQSEDNYYIAPQDFDDFDEIFAGQFEQEIDSIMSESIGSILAAVGEAVTSNEENNNESRVSTFGNKITNFGDELNLEIHSKVNSLENKADSFCQSLNALDGIESQLNQTIPALEHFDLINEIN